MTLDALLDVPVGLAVANHADAGGSHKTLKDASGVVDFHIRLASHGRYRLSYAT